MSNFKMINSKDIPDIKKIKESIKRLYKDSKILSSYNCDSRSEEVESYIRVADFLETFFTDK